MHKNPYTQQTINNIFSSVSSKYDLMNDIMSFGLHRIWHKKLMQTVNPKNKTKLIDVASGTAKAAINYLKTTSDTHATICDINKEMLEKGRINILNNCLIHRAHAICCPAEKLTTKNKQFDYYTISFGIRNVSSIPKALKEAFRVLKQGGKFYCLEFSKIDNCIVKKFYDLYSSAIPKVGKTITDNRFAYEYLIETISKFYNADELSHIIEDAGFKNVNYTKLNFGIVAIHCANK